MIIMSDIERFLHNHFSFQTPDMTDEHTNSLISDC